MIILGSERIITQDYTNHKFAEDYSGIHKSPINFNGSGKVIRVVNKYIPHEDSINYYDFSTNQYRYKDGDYYNCISITGKTVRLHKDELGGNCVIIECNYNNEKYTLGVYHLATTSVNVGDIINQDTIIGYQGNTGLVASNKAKNDPTYGTHIHFEAKKNNTYINPRGFATGEKIVSYQEQSNKRDPNLLQCEILVDSIRIRKETNVSSLILGKVYKKEIYTILEKIEDDSYFWLKILTNTGITGFIATSKTDAWVKVYEKETPTPSPTPESKMIKVFTCDNSDTYYIKLNKGEEVYIKK